MKEIKAVVRPNKLPALREALRDIPGFPGMTVSKAEGCSAPSRHGSPANIKEELTDYTPKVRIEIVADDPVADVIVDRIIAISQTGQIGDGLVWVTPVDRAAFIFKTTPGSERF
ncbi:nitrogen regulatory protein P-II 1 [Azospira sp. I13]|uniref:P-II family nitrogen regulator n=1 Tax=Azospira sp. I13 TaxID=1765050 RepID=UPI000D4B6296|nr:P-II family nitrogen regulator [Azospira sp. I13]GBG03269.1 nitrogen regulatory protein P-II 1 [Azospira sp. I13]